MARKRHFESLDFLRGIAAILVVADHARGFVFESYADLIQDGRPIGLLIKMFYFATGLGNQSVIVFFALSGFLVGGKASENIIGGEFSWVAYLLRRLTRLWIVVVPALFVTLAFDWLGSALTHGAGYHARYYVSDQLIDHSFLTFFGNIAFLQTIVVPPFGSNGPIWSLAYEFWYYIIFPLIFWIATTHAKIFKKIWGVAILVLLTRFLPIGLLEGGVIWVAGAAAAWLTHQGALSRLFTSVGYRFVAIVLMVGGLIMSKMPELGVGDQQLGLMIALALPAVAWLPSAGKKVSAIARGLSNISYTLYLSHFPLLMVIVLSSFAPTKWPPGFTAAGIFIVLLAAAILWAVILWWCFERRTDDVYWKITRKLSAAKVIEVR